MKGQLKTYMSAATCGFVIIFGGAELSFAKERAFTLETAAYDLRHYDVDLAVDVQKKMIDGTVTVKANIASPLRKLSLYLDTNYEVSSVQIINSGDQKRLLFNHKEVVDEVKNPWITIRPGIPYKRLGVKPPEIGKLSIDLDREYEAGETIQVAISYSGNPAERVYGDSWITSSYGFIWEQTKDQQPWVGLKAFPTAQWLPSTANKAEKLEEGATLHFTTTDNLAVVSNGRYERRVQNSDGTATHHWRVTTPIVTKYITFNAGPFRQIQQPYKSVTGKTLPVTYWVLPELYEEMSRIFPQVIEYLHFLEATIGPYPFQADTIEFITSPSTGLEGHPTQYNPQKQREEFPEFDRVINGYHMTLFHELTHTWWANLVVPSTNDEYWMTDIGVYMEALFFEQKYGERAYHEGVHRKYGGWYGNKEPVLQYPEKLKMTSFKGGLMLHTLRFLIGKEKTFALFRHLSYPDPDVFDIEKISRGRIITTKKFEEIANGVCQCDLRWFFDMYSRQLELPKIVTEDLGDKLLIEWQVPNDMQFPMPIEIDHNGVRRRIAMPNGKAIVSKKMGDSILVDPNIRVLRQAKFSSGQFGSLLK